ncbi:ribosome biogenesis GTPase Der [Desulfovibrio sp. OttesenSCG-928-G15]|nr:ribosome biogenesis GTPase Der [Desulfovibrio sp. OttesenSCG-928-G15]
MTTQRIPRVALLGRPNVGKSTLFNRLIRSNRAITHDMPGVTRDRMEGTVKARGLPDFALVDTGGVTLDSHARVQEGPEGIRGFEEDILEQAKDALKESDLVCLVVDGREGLSPLDAHLADFLRKSGKPLLLVVNKVDGPERQDILLAEFHGLGLETMAVSAAHGFNVRSLEDVMRDVLFPPAVTTPDEEDAFLRENAMLFAGATRRQKKRLRDSLIAGQQTPDGVGDVTDDSAGDDAATVPAQAELTGGPKGPDDSDEPDDSAHPGDAGASAEPDDSEVSLYNGPDLYSGPLRLALLGRPNAGKSSLVNALAGQKRMIVSDVAGTTRDSVDVAVEIDGDSVTFVDTAGVRRRAKITDTVERYSVNSSLKSTTKAHVTLLVMDATEGITQQDKRLIDLLHERKTPFMLLVNKSDLLEPRKRKEIERDFREALVFCPHVPLIFVSAKNRHNLKNIVPTARSIRRECGVRVPTGKLNRAMTAVLERHQPPIVKRVRAKFFYLTQAESLPPTFVFFVNDAERILPSYARYLERSLRKMFNIAHAPMRVNFRSSHMKKKRKR